MRSGRHHDVIGRVAGLLVFLLGVGLLLCVFYMAWGLFQMPAARALGLHFTGNPKTDPMVATVGTQMAWLLFRLGYLFVMSVAGSLIANKGINLYFSALYGVPPNAPHVAPTE
ncbi:MAG: hypothetical protein KGJ62_01925 [Armatimonadetes bacterium]|nr:hypothetical protein [Armatimonadota bacterium]MDE2206732.1 hypothetical protein [Armatimonadota bacterium]